jgi:hypothetical protein
MRENKNFKVQIFLFLVYFIKDVLQRKFGISFINSQLRTSVQFKKRRYLYCKSFYYSLPSTGVIWNYDF